MDLRPPLRRRAGVALVIATLVLAATLTGCGGGASIPKADFLARGNAICQQGSRDWDSLVKKLPASPIAAREKYVVRTLVPHLTNVVNSLRSIGYPSGDQAYLDSIYADVDVLVAKMKDQPSTDLQLRLDAPYAAPAPRFEAYGLTRCAKL